MNRPKVFLRLRPPLQQNEYDDEPFGELTQNNTEFTYVKHSEQTYRPKIKSTMRFDQVFTEDAIQQNVYENISTDILNNLLSGLTVGLIMYGPTGSGKTYSMDGIVGDVDQQGLLPRIIQASIDHISQRSSKYEMSLSCIQIYNDKIDDMLANNPSKNIDKSCHTLQRTSKIVNPNTYVNVMKLYSMASKRRHVGANKFHAQSSRSHAITQLTFQWIPAENNKIEKTSKIIFVDLAGSEDEVEINSIGGGPGGSGGDESASRVVMTRQEGKSIRSSLLHFKNVMRDLVSSYKRGGKRTVLNCGNTLTLILDHLFTGESAIHVLLCLSNKMCYAIENTTTLRTGLDILQFPLAPKKNKVKQEIELIDTIADQQIHIADLRSELEKAREAANETEYLNENEKQIQLSQKAEINELLHHLNKLRAEMMEKDKEIQSLNEINCDLEIAKDKLKKLLQTGITERNRTEYTELQKKIAEKESLLRNLRSLDEELSIKLQSALSKQNQLESLQQQLVSLENIDPQTDEVRGNIMQNKLSFNTNTRTLDKLNHEIKKIVRRKEELEREVNNLKHRVDANLLAQRHHDAAIQRLATLDLEMKDLIRTIQGIPHTIPPSNQEIQCQELQHQLEQEIAFVRQDVNKKNEMLSSTKLNLEIALNALPEEQRQLACEAIQIYENQKDIRAISLQQIDALTDDLNNLDDRSDDEDEGDSQEIQLPKLGRSLKEDLFKLKEIEYNDELKILIHQLPYNIENLTHFLSFHPSCKERFLELGGVDAVVKYISLAIQPSTFAYLCGLLEKCLYDEPRVYQIIKAANTLREIEKWFQKIDWIDYGQGTHVLALDAISGLCSTKYFTEELASCYVILRIVCHFIVNSEIQSVLQAACRCLALLCPSESAFDNIYEKNKKSQFITNLTISLINLLSNPSAPCRREAAFCISKLYSQPFLREEFERHETLKYVLSVITKQDRNNNTASQALSVLLLTVIEANNASLEANINVRRMAYESIAIGIATRVASEDVESLQVSGISPELPYTAEIIRGEWSTKATNYTHGGPVTHGFFFDNPMYSLTIPPSDSSSTSSSTTNDEILVSFALKKMPGKHPSDDDDATLNGRRRSFANLRIAPLSTFLDDTTNFVRDSETLKSLIAEKILSGKIPINTMCFKHHYKTTYPTDNVDTFKLKRGETYIIIPQSEVRGIHEYFIMAIVGDAKFILKELRESLQKQIFDGHFNLPSSSVSPARYDEFEDPSWRSFPQLLIEPSIVKPELFIAMVSYLDVDSVYDELFLQHDEIFPSSLLDDKYSKRPNFRMKLYDVTDAEKRVVYSPNMSVESASCWLSSSWVLLYAPLLPNKRYMLCVGLNGEYGEDEKLPYRLQIFHSPCQLLCTPLSRDHEWYPNNQIFPLTSTSSPLVLTISSSSTSATPLSINGHLTEEESQEKKMSSKSLLLNFRLFSSNQANRNLKIKISNNQYFQQFIYYIFTDDLDTENPLAVHDWLSDSYSGKVFISIEYLSSGTPPTKDDIDYFTLTTFSSLPLTVTTTESQEGSSQIATSSSSLSSAPTHLQSALSAVKYEYPSPLNWMSDCWLEPSRQHKLYNAVPIKKKVVVDLLFLQDLYLQINKFMILDSATGASGGSGGTRPQQDWEISTLSQLSEHIDSNSLSRFTSKMKKLSAKDIRDIFVEIQTSTSFGSGLFTGEELSLCCGSVGGGSREGRINFMKKLIQYIEILLKKPIHPTIEPNNLSAGNRPEDSARLLRKLCDAVSTTSRSSWRDAIQLIQNTGQNNTNTLTGSPTNVVRLLSPR